MGQILALTMPILTVEALRSEAALFSAAESQHQEPFLFMSVPREQQIFR